MATAPNIASPDFESQDMPESKRRQLAPVEGPAPGQADTEDPCNSKLEDTDPEVVAALKSIVSDLARQSIVARRWQIRRVRRAELYWQSLQYLWVNPVDQQLYTPTEARIFDDSASQDQPRYQFVTNIYQAYGLQFIAVVSQDVPDVAFFPEDPNDEEDVTAAKAANDVAELIQRNNDPQKIFIQLGYHAWTGGLLAIYVRYVTDGQKFGWDSLDDLDSVPVNVAPESYLCPNCGKESDTDNITGFCPYCGAPLGEENLKPSEYMDVPQATQTVRVPRGQECISVYGALECNDPIWANEQDEFPYHSLQFEVPRARLRAVYPWAKDKLAVEGNVLADDQYARVSRISVKEALPQPVPTDMLYELITFTRNWLRPYVFELVRDDEVRERLYELFPDGCYVAFAGGAYCESRSESLDDHWVIRHAMPGEGVNRPAIGDTLMEIQDQVNTYRNIAVETYEYGIPPIYADSEVLDFDALQQQTSEPGSTIPARARAGMGLPDGFFQPNPAVVSPQMQAELVQLVGPLSELLTGMYPALAGGDTGENETARGISIQRDQAMGRVGLPWKTFKEAWAKTIELCVKCFRENRADDVTLAQKDPSKKPITIRLADLKGNFKAYAEADSQYPRLKSDIRASVEHLMGMVKDFPALAELFTEPSNMEYIQEIMGLLDMTIPGADSRDKQMREIEELLDSQPIVNPMNPQQMQPSIPVGKYDRHEFELAECVRWFSSEPGMQAQKMTPMGYANVMAHADAHAAAIKAAQQPPQQKPPSESINFADLPPEGQAQMAAQAGIQITPPQINMDDVKDTLLKKMPISEEGPGKESKKDKFPQAGPATAGKKFPAPSGEGAQ